MMVIGKRRAHTSRQYKALRAAAGLTQRDVALATRIPASRYWDIENAYAEPTDAERMRIARVLRVEVTALPRSEVA